MYHARKPTKTLPEDPENSMIIFQLRNLCLDVAFLETYRQRVRQSAASVRPRPSSLINLQLTSKQLI